MSREDEVQQKKVDQLVEDTKKFAWLLENLHALDMPDQLYIVARLSNTIEDLKPIYTKYERRTNVQLEDLFQHINDVIKERNDED